MTKEQAMETIKQVAELFVGNLKEHAQVQDAIKLIENELKDKVPTKSDKS